MTSDGDCISVSQIDSLGIAEAPRLSRASDWCIDHLGLVWTFRLRVDTTGLEVGVWFRPGPARRYTCVVFVFAVVVCDNSCIVKNHG